MVASNPSSRPAYARVYNLTPAGSRLAHYLEYVESHPTVASDINFGSVPPEHFDDDCPQPQQPLDCVQELKRLHEDLDREIQCLFAYAEGDSDRFREQRVRVTCLREQIKTVRARCLKGE